MPAVIISDGISYALIIRSLLFSRLCSGPFAHWQTGRPLAAGR